MKILVSLLMSLLFMPLGFAQYQQKTEVRAELVDRYPVKFTFRFLLDGEIQEFEKIYECRVIEVNRYYQGKVVKVERKALEWDTNGRYKNIDHILEDGSAIRLKFSRSSLAQGCPRDGQQEEVNWAAYLEDHQKDNRWLADVYWVDSITEPKEAFKVTVSNKTYDSRDGITLFFTPLGYSSIKVSGNMAKYVSTEVPSIDGVECFDYRRHYPGRTKYRCALKHSKFSHVYAKDQWSKIAPLKNFLTRQKKPIFLDPALYAEIRPLYSYSEDLGDLEWSKRQGGLGNLSKEYSLKWRGEGAIWRPEKQLKLRIDKSPLHNVVWGRLNKNKIFDFANSPMKTFLYYGGPRSTSDPFFLEDGDELKIRENFKSSFTKVKIGSKVFDLEDYREFSEKNRFGLYFYDPETEYLIHTYR
ncbi:hypothetical protein [Paremcibacter congregatus]|uniref:hypothetical protein n=1 Tax=Paremcibacter congregatus TaxID=2043170 RepID=UPI0030ED5A32|tara:strand:- start:11019 stop:12257 length:1239 start_codon:yes stop_codon:yes gene_type:complete